MTDSLRSGESRNQVFDKYNSSNTNNRRIVVIAEHNSKQYQVDGMTDEFTPSTYSFTDKTGNEVTMRKYF